MAKKDPSGGLYIQKALEAFVSPEKYEALRITQEEKLRLERWTTVGTPGFRARCQAEQAYAVAEGEVLGEFGDKLRCGEIVAFGIPEPVSAGAQYQKISAVLWEILCVISWEKSTVKGGGQVFHLVKFFDSAELVSRTGTSGARHNCYKWLLKLA